MSFSIRLKKIMSEKKINQQELAKLSGLQPTAISHFEAGRRKPSYDNIKKLSDALNISADFLLGRDESPKASLNALFRNAKKLGDNEVQQLQDFSEFLKQKGKGEK
jgi:transcriptional regulator with XRE-family HTH domain